MAGICITIQKLVKRLWIEAETATVWGIAREVIDIVLNQIKNIVKSNPIDGIYLTGYVELEDDGIAQFYADMRFLYLEFGDVMVELGQFDPANQSSKLRIIIVNSVQHYFELEDVKPGRSKINDVIFKNPLAENRVAKIYFYNYEESDNELLCDALHIKLCNGQNIFLDPGFLGINIGGLDVKQVWKENLINGVIPQKICIEFDK